MFQRWSLQIKQLKLQATHFAKAYCSLSALVAVMLLSAFLHISSDKKNQIHVYLLPVIDFSTQQHGKEISRFSALIRKSLSAVPVITVTSGSNTAHIDTQLVCSFQQIADRLRLTWGIYRASDMVQTAGGIVTGKIADIAGLEDTLLQRVIGRLESDQNALSYLRD